MHHEQMIAMKTGANPLHRPPAPVDSQTEQEDPYGRCTNMRLTSFTDKGTAGGQGTTGVPRDPRLIDLSQSSAVSTGNLGHVPPQNLSNGGGGGNWGGPPPPQSQSQNVSNFNTLPAHMTQQHQVRVSNIFQNKLNIYFQAHVPGGQMPGHHPHNTLPARVGDNSPRNLHFPNNVQPSGRHFKPFDHRKINPMAEIQENPYEQQASTNGYGNGHVQAGPVVSGNGQCLPPDNTYIVHHNTHIPHMPSELRHTNYGNNKPHLVHPQVLQHRDQGPV